MTKECRLRISHTIVVETERSLWYITPVTYRREFIYSSGTTPLDDSLNYNIDIPYREAFVTSDPLGERIRLVPSSRWDGAVGVITGYIQHWRPGGADE